MSTQREETCHHNYSNSGGLIIITRFVKIVWVSYHFSYQGGCCDRNDYSRHDEEVNHQTSTAEMFPLILEGSHPEMTSVVKGQKGQKSQSQKPSAKGIWEYLPFPPLFFWEKGSTD